MCIVHNKDTSRDGAVVARRAHNPKVTGSSPVPATNQHKSLTEKWDFFYGILTRYTSLLSRLTSVFLVINLLKLSVSSKKYRFF